MYQFNIHHVKQNSFIQLLKTAITRHSLIIIYNVAMNEHWPVDCYTVCLMVSHTGICIFPMSWLLQYNARFNRLTVCTECNTTQTSPLHQLSLPLSVHYAITSIAIAAVAYCSSVCGLWTIRTVQCRIDLVSFISIAGLVKVNLLVKYVSQF